MRHPATATVDSGKLHSAALALGKEPGLPGLRCLERFLEGQVKVVMLGDAAPHDRLEIGDVSNVNDLIHALDEGGHGVVRGETLAEEDDEMLPPQRTRPSHY